jgi:transcription termination/antitermination protein NusG
MATSIRAVHQPSSSADWISAATDPRWYALYTQAHHEKKTAAEILRRGVESFLPLYRSPRRWSDRRIELEIPLFQGYVFVHLALSDRLKVLQVPGVVRLVGFGGLPVPLPQDQIETLRSGLRACQRAAPHPYLTTGRRVRFRGGPLAGMFGILLRRKGKFRVVIALELIQRAMVVDVDAADVELA